MLKRKNILACLLALVMLLSLAACGGGGGDSQPSGGDSQPSGDAGQAAPADARRKECLDCPFQRTPCGAIRIRSS